MITVRQDLCTGCSLCVPSCPDEAIACFGWAVVDDRCSNCQTCLPYCPVEALTSEERHTDD
ncbi:MAG: 4Fe-4S binding protein [Thermodesulfobacteriota bacterium]